MIDDKNAHEIEDNLFSRKKKLLTVQQYASSQGISTGIVDEAARLGVVQIRRHKNKTFIVDLPLDACKNIRQESDCQSPAVSQPFDTVQQAQKISEMVNKIFQPAQPAAKPAAAVNKPVAKTSIDEKQPITEKTQSQIPDLKLFDKQWDLPEIAAAAEIENIKPVEPAFKISLIRRLRDFLQTASGNKLVIIGMSFVILVCYFAYAWTSYQSQMQQKKLQRAYENMTKLINEKDAALRKAQLYELESANWRAESMRNKKSIASLEVELVQTKERLLQAEKDLAAAQQNHVSTLRQLNQQIQEIANRVKSEKSKQQ